MIKSRFLSVIEAIQKRSKVVLFKTYKRAGISNINWGPVLGILLIALSGLFVWVIFDLAINGGFK